MPKDNNINNMLSYTTQEPIYALATSYSPSALAVIRASGEGSLSLFAPFFKGRLLTARSNQAVHGYIIDKDGKKIDEVMVIRYDQGRGYTSEEAFEIMSHGSLAVIRAISKVLEEAGFRQAMKGEFSYRAFMHGRMDLTEAEAVEELVKAKGDRARGDALDRLVGSLKNEADNIKRDIVDILASLEVQLDYGEDEIIEPWIFPKEKVDSIIARLESIKGTYKASRLYSEGATVVLAGRTNAGKSSLFNALLKENRAIVSSIAGTTRDYLEVQAEIDGIPVRLFDTAGLRDSSDEIEAEGIRRSESLMESSDLIVYVLDGDEKEGEESDRTLYVHSKSDLTEIKEALSFSSKTGEGIADVAKAIADKLRSEIVEYSDVPQIESERQKRMLEETIDALKDAKKAKGMSVDIIALYFQSALSSLAYLTGETTNDDILEVLFSSFCLGK